MRANTLSPAPVPPPAQISFTSELARKATHMFALIIPGGYYFLSLDKTTMLTIMVPISICMVLIDIARLRHHPLWTRIFQKLFSRMIRAHEQAGDFTGATYILAATVATVALFTKPIAIAALTYIIVGDTLAAVVGRRFGRHKFMRNKSIEGSLACFLGCAAAGILLPGLSLPIALAGALTATIVEALPLNIDDNVTVPLLAGLVMTLLP